MKRVPTLVILGCLALSTQGSARAQSAPSDWPALDANGAQSNYNANEKSLTANNVLKLKVRWAASISDASYPIVAGGRVYLPFVSGSKIHVRVLDARTGRRLTLFPKDASGGMLVANGSLYLAGHALKVVDPSSGQELAEIKGGAYPKGEFLHPEADHQVLMTGYVNGRYGHLYTIDASANQISDKLPSTSAFGTFASGNVVTASGTGSIFYDEHTGKPVARAPYPGSDWFAAPPLAYTVVSVKRHPATLEAVDGTGKRIWGKVVGPALSTYGSDWPHAVSTGAVFAANERGQPGVQAFNPLSGRVLWTHHLADVQKMALANNLLFVLTSSLFQPVQLTILRASSGTAVGSVVLSGGYYAFGAPNELMVAAGMVFIRAVGPSGSELVALGR